MINSLKSSTITYTTLSRFFSDEIADFKYRFIIFSAETPVDSRVIAVCLRILYEAISWQDWRDTHLSLLIDEITDPKYRFKDESLSWKCSIPVCISWGREGERCLILSVRASRATRLFCEASVFSRHVDSFRLPLVIEMTSVERTSDSKAMLNREQTNLSVFSSRGSSWAEKLG